MMSNESNGRPRWQKRFRHGDDVAEQLRRLANCFDGVGELPAEFMMIVNFHATAFRAEHTVRQAVAVVDQICTALGIQAMTAPVFTGVHRSDSEPYESGVSVVAQVLTAAEVGQAWAENEQYDRDLAALADTTGVIETAQAAAGDVRQVA